MVRAHFVSCVLLAGFVGACSCGAPLSEDQRFACAGDAECADGHRCFQGTCLDAEDPVFQMCVSEACGDGEDNDCDALPDCDDSDCCADCGTCERACTDGVDEDGDGATDCADGECDGVSCGANGLTCQAGACACPTGQVAETTCANGTDDDCDGLADCADPDCAAKPCDANVASAACCPSEDGTTGACVNLAASRSNCGGCGVACHPSRACTAVTTTDGRASGACVCGPNDQCPNGGGATCIAAVDHCGCTGASGCAAGQDCVGDATAPGYCVYP